MLRDDNEDLVLESLMNEVSDHLADGYVAGAADGLAIIADYYARAGLPMPVFMGMRKHLIDMAEQKAGCPTFIRESLAEAERLLCAKRTTPSTIIIH